LRAPTPDEFTGITAFPTLPSALRTRTAALGDVFPAGRSTPTRSLLTPVPGLNTM
jgi:hypothetical protein